MYLILLTPVVFIVWFAFGGLRSPLGKALFYLSVSIVAVSVITIFWAVSVLTKQPQTNYPTSSLTNVACDAVGTMGSNGNCYCPTNLIYEAGKGCVDPANF